MCAPTGELVALRRLGNCFAVAITLTLGRAAVRMARFVGRVRGAHRRPSPMP